MIDVNKIGELKIIFKRMILYKGEFLVSGVNAFLRNITFVVKRWLISQQFKPGTFMVVARPVFLLIAIIKNKERGTTGRAGDRHI